MGSCGLISPKEIVEFYRLRQRGFSKLYTILVLITINLFSVSVLLDVAKFFLALPLLQAGILVLAFTLIVGAIDKLRLERGRSHLFLMLVESLRVTSYTILPILMIFVTVLFYLGMPSEFYFQNLRGVLSALIVFLMLSVMAKIMIVQIQVLISPFEDKRILKYLMYFGAIIIGLTSTISYVLSDMLLPSYLTEWYMYETFIFFLELVFLYLSAEVALNYRTSIYILMFFSYVAVIFFSLTGGAEILRLSYMEYASVFPKIVTGIFLLSINTQLIESRLKHSPSGQLEDRIRRETVIEEILDLLEDIRRDINTSKKTIEKQDDTIKVLSRVVEKMTTSSSGAIEELRKELENIKSSQTISSANALFSRRLAEGIVKLCDSHKEFSMAELAGFILGPKPSSIASKRTIDLENVSPIPLFLMTCMAFMDLKNLTNDGRVHQKDVAEFLISHHPHFHRKWSKRTAQNFVNFFTLRYVKAHREAEPLFDIGNRGTIALSKNSTTWSIYEAVKEHILNIGPENISFILLYMSKARDLVIRELKISENELKKVIL